MRLAQRALCVQACAGVLLKVLSLATLGAAGQSTSSSAPSAAAAPSLAKALSVAHVAAPPSAAAGPAPAGAWGAPQQPPGYNGTGLEVPYSTFSLGDVRSPLAVHASLALTAGFGIGSLVLLWLVVLCLAARRRRYEDYQRALTAHALGAAVRGELERRRKLAEAAQQRASARQVVVVINPCNGVQCAVKLDRASAGAAPPVVRPPPPPPPLPREPAEILRPAPLDRVLYLW